MYYIIYIISYIVYYIYTYIYNVYIYIRIYIYIIWYISYIICVQIIPPKYPWWSASRLTQHMTITTCPKWWTQKHMSQAPSLFPFYSFLHLQPFDLGYPLVTLCDVPLEGASSPNSWQSMTFHELIISLFNQNQGNLRYSLNRPYICWLRSQYHQNISISHHYLCKTIIQKHGIIPVSGSMFDPKSLNLNHLHYLHVFIHFRHSLKEVRICHTWI